MRTEKTDQIDAPQIQLAQLEDVIQTAESWERERAIALLKIQRLRLWHPVYESFEDYGQKRWGYDNSYLYRQCEWAKVLDVLPIGRKPERESHARPLYGLTAAQQVTAWRQVIRSKDKPTAAIVSEVVAATLRRSTPHKPSVELPKVSGAVVRGDAVKMLATLKDKSVDLLLTSPPYAMQRAKYFPSIEEHNYPKWTVNWFDAARSKMKTSGSVMFVAREHIRNGCISDYLLRTRLALRDAGWHEIDVLIWSKPDAPPTGRMDRPRRAYESIFWYSTTPNPYADVTECGRPNSDRKRMVKCKADNRGDRPFARFRVDQNARITDIIHAAVSGSAKTGADHPAVYPPSLCDQLIRTFSPAGGLVIDPFCGSGTTLLAARDAGRHWWGCDIMKKYVQLTRNRLAAANTR